MQPSYSSSSPFLQPYSCCGVGPKRSPSGKTTPAIPSPQECLRCCCCSCRVWPTTCSSPRCSSGSRSPRYASGTYPPLRGAARQASARSRATLGWSNDRVRKKSTVRNLLRWSLRAHRAPDLLEARKRRTDQATQGAACRVPSSRCRSRHFLCGLARAEHAYDPDRRGALPTFRGGPFHERGPVRGLRGRPLQGDGTSGDGARGSRGSRRRHHREPRGERVAVQCKNYMKPANNKAVQEVFAGARHHRCVEAWVVAPAGYTRGAIELAKSTGVALYDADTIRQWISEVDKLEKERASETESETRHASPESTPINEAIAEARERAFWHPHPDDPPED